MTERLVELDASVTSSQVAWYTIGFGIVSEHDNVEDVVSAGSGSLVTTGSVSGILTAAHVLTNLPDKGEVAIVLYHDLSSQFQRQKIEMEHAVKIIFRGEKFGPDGPDLGFLRLPPKNVSSLKATNVFANLGMIRKSILARQQPAPSYVDAIIGVIAERTKDLPPKRPKERLKQFEALFSSGKTVNEREINGYDLVDFEVTSKPDFKLPTSYKGTSGGALWQFYFAMEDNMPKVVGKRLFGVPFFQSAAKDKRTITCHGPRSIYDSLIDKLVATWPEATPPK